MSLVTGTLAPLVKIKFKPRCDDYTDQFNRILMVKLSMVACVVLGLHWFKDTLNCIMPDNSGIDGGFVTQACWIRGLYTYDGIDEINGKELRYYGIPKQLRYDGRRGSEFCKSDGEDAEEGCDPLHKTFYKQYQWFPFYMGAIALLYYVPYIFYRWVNGDLISLKAVVKTNSVNAEDICRCYFDHKRNPKYRMYMRLLGNVLCKGLYCMVNIIALLATNACLDGKFLSLGSEMANWNSLDNNAMLDYTHTRSTFRPGDRMLPAYGICEVLELAQDVKHSLYNRHKFVCEISQNVLYQYTLFFLWFCLVIGLVLSAIGLLRSVVEHCFPLSYSPHGDETKEIAEDVQLTLRECQYLEFIRKKQVAVYKELIKHLKEQRGGH